MSRSFVVRPLLLGLLLVALGACSDPTTDAPDARRGGSEDASGDIIALDAARLDRGPQNDALIGDAAPDQAVDAAPDQAVDAALDMALPLDQSVDSAPADALSADALLADALPLDAAPADLAPPDLSPPDQAVPDAEPIDLAPPDHSLPDQALPDAEPIVDAAPIDAALPDAAPPEPAPPAVVIVVLRGADPATLDAARTRLGGPLSFDDLPIRRDLRPASLSGVTDPIAAMSALALGQKTLNGFIGLDPNDVPVDGLLAQAAAAGLGAGFVTTDSLVVPAPAAFYAHRRAPADAPTLAADLAASSLTVALGGGAGAFGEGSAPLTALRDAGVRVVRTSAALAAAEPEPGVPLFGFFAPQTLDFAVDRVDPAQPSLAGLTRAALVHLDAPETGFALVIDAGRIGEAVRAGQADRALGEVLAAHEAVAAVRAFAAARGSMTLLVTAAFRAQPAGATRFTESNDDVTLFAEGAGAADLPELGSLDLVAVTAAARAALFGGPLELPTTLVPDGDLRDLRWRAADQRYVSNFGAGFNSLTGLSVDADGHGLAIGLSGAFERRAAGTGNAVIVLVDADFGRATGPNALDGRFNDLDGAADRALSRLNLAAPPVPGFGADFAFALVGGQPIRFNAPPAAGELVAFGGLRGVADRPDDFAWLPSTVNIAPQAVALPGMPGQPVAEPLPTRGLEVSLPWTALYPDGFPQRMRIGLIALLSNGDDCASNQFLPVLPNDPVQPCAGGINALPAVIVADLELSPEGVPAVRNIAIFP